MYTPKPTSRFILFSLILLLLLTFLAPSISSELDIADEDGDDMEGLEELIALDEEEDLQQQQKQEGAHHEKPSEAEFVSKAQRIVLELNNDNTKRAIDGNEYVLVLGYTPWCARSAELMPKFAEAATALKELGSPLLMAKIDAERYPKVASTLEIKGFPTLLLFVNGTSQPYTGGFSAEELVIWARKKTGVPVIRISSDAEANHFLKKHSMFVVGLFEKFEGPDYDEFRKAAEMDNEIQFVETSNAEIAKHLFPDFKPTSLFLGLVKSEPEKYTEYEGTFSTDGILQFLDDNKFPLITVLAELNAARVYSNTNKLQVLIIAEPDDFKKLVEPLQDVARKFKSKIMFIFVDIREDNLAKPFLTMFGLEESNDSVVVSFNYSSSLKYLLESDTTPTSIKDFCSGLLSETVSPYYKSQPIPDNKNVSILTVVGKTFDELILNSPENILLEIYTPWCITCETTSKQMEKLAKHFKGLDNLIFARIDASLNEHPKLLGWEETVVKQDQSNEGESEMKILLPSMPSLYVTSFLFQACEEIQRVGGHVLDKPILKNFASRLLDKMIHIYGDFLSSQETQGSRVSEKGVLQVLLDLRFASDILSSGDSNANDESLKMPKVKHPFRRKQDVQLNKSVSEERANGLISSFAQGLDPIDWLTYEPYLWENERQSYLRHAVLLGFFVQLNRMYTDTAQKLPTNSESNIMRCSAVPRFKYLPISAPALSSRGTTKASISASMDDISSRSPWKSYTNNELSRKVDIDENSSSGITAPFLKSFMQVGSKFGESTLKLGSILTDGQVGRFGDILPVQASGFHSFFTAARSE